MFRILYYDYLKAVEETFEQELHQAILLSKLAYEEQLVSVAKNEKEQEQNKKPGKKSKKATMSLEEFNSMGTSVTVGPLTNEPTVDKSRGIETLSNSFSMKQKNYIINVKNNVFTNNLCLL